MVLLLLCPRVGEPVGLGPPLLLPETAVVLASAEGCIVPVMLATIEAVSGVVAEGALELEISEASAEDGLAMVVGESEHRDVSLSCFPR